MQRLQAIPAVDTGVIVYPFILERSWSVYHVSLSSRHCVRLPAGIYNLDYKILRAAQESYKLEASSNKYGRTITLRHSIPRRYQKANESALLW